MNTIPVIAVFDAGKTNKKIFLFDRGYKIVYEESNRFDEITDEDGYPCEDLNALTSWVHQSLKTISSLRQFSVDSINFTSYGASFVHLDEAGQAFLPLYNYLKPIPEALNNKFYNTYGGETQLSRETASPVLGSLNSGLQLYRLKYEKDLVNKNGYSLHLPQYLSFLVTGKYYSDITSIGCHTMLWNFTTNAYHSWVIQENLLHRLAPLFPSDG